jgi:hypothetical protein
MHADVLLTRQKIQTSSQLFANFFQLCWRCMAAMRVLSIAVVALAHVAAAREYVGDTDPDGTVHGVEAFVR